MSPRFALAALLSLPLAACGGVVPPATSYTPVSYTHLTLPTNREV